MSLVISGVLLWGLIGWGLAAWLHSRVFVGLGLVIGGVLGVVLVYLRYGREQSGPPVTVGPVALRGHTADAAASPARPDQSQTPPRLSSSSAAPDSDPKEDTL
jgi:hypothetical protein